MMNGTPKQTYRIHYKREDGSTGFYHVRETNAFFAITQFRLHTNQSEDSVLSVEVQIGHEWRTALYER